MIQPNELRIGNLIWDNERNKERLVTHRIISDIVSNVGNNNHENDFSPILLTEQWLLKLGFEDASYSKDFKILKIELNDSSFRIEVRIMSRSFSVDLMSCDGTSDCIQNELNLTDSCIYVHQLQNLFFSLTGKELEYDTSK